MRALLFEKLIVLVAAVLLASVAGADDKRKAERVDLVGKVTDTRGAPIADANVVVIYKSWPNDRYRQQSLNTKTNKRGEFSLEKLYRTGEQTAFLVSIVKNGFALESVYVLNEDGAELKPFEFEMTAAKPLTVRLVDKKGQPLAEAAVAPKQRTTPDGEELFLYHQSLPSAQVTADADGRVEMGYFRAGDEAEIQVFANGNSTGSTFRVEDEDELQITVDIKERFDLTGSVLTEDNQAVAKATVLLIFKSWPNNRYRQLPLATKTDERGKFSFPRLFNEGDRTAFLVSIVEDGFAMESRYVINQKGNKQDFTFKLAAAKALNVQLVDESGKPLARASVFPTRRKTRDGDEHLVYHHSGRSITRQTDARGQIALNLFEQGDSVELSVKHGGKSTTVSFKVGSADEQVVPVGADLEQSRQGRWQPEPREAPAEQIAWIRKSAIPLKSTSPADEDFSDLLPLKKLIGDARIVQLGEQSHGDGTCFETKTRLIKFLHQEMGFDVLAFESGLFDCRKAWQAFRVGEPASDAARQGIFGIWTGSQQVQPLIEYLAARAESERPLELCGFDSQFTAAGSREHLVKDLRRLIEALQIEEPAAKELDAVYYELGRLSKHQRRTPDDPAPLLKTLGDIGEAIATKTGLNEQQSRDARFWQQALKSIRAHATTKWSTDTPNINARDLQMGKNLVWLANDFYQGRKIIVWAASFHIMRNPAEIEVPSGVVNYKDIVPMGHHVARELGDDVFTIAFTAYDGTAGAYFRPNVPIGKAPTGTLEAICNSAGLTNAVIPLRELDGGGEWLGEKQFSRPLGYSWMKARWPRHFDAMVFNREMKPSTGVSR